MSFRVDWHGFVQGTCQNDQPSGQQNESVYHGSNNCNFGECLPLLETQDISTEINKSKERDEQTHSGPPHGEFTVLLQLSPHTKVNQDKNAEQGYPLKSIDPQEQPC